MKIKYSTYFKIFVTIFSLRSLEIVGNCVHAFNRSTMKKGYISSPNYPNFYPSNSECWYFFYGTVYEGLSIKFEEFDLKEKNKFGCLNDYLEIYNIGDNGLKHLINRLCGNIDNISKTIFSFQSNMELRFKSDNSGSNTRFKGFIASFEFVNEENFEPYFKDHFAEDIISQVTHYNGNNFSRPIISTNLKNNTLINDLSTKFQSENMKCGKFIKDKKFGIIQSPGYPFNYESSLECVWVIRVQKYWRIYMRMEELDLEGGLSGCNTANVKIYDGYKTLIYTDIAILNMCGNIRYFQNEYDRSFLTDRNLAVVRFKTSPEAKGINPDSCTGIICKNSEACIAKKTGPCRTPTKFCVPKSLKCDGVQHCPGSDNSDEFKCYMQTLLLLAVCVPILVIIVISTVLISKKYYNLCSTSKSKIINDKSSDELQNINKYDSLLIANIHKLNSLPCNLPKTDINSSLSNDCSRAIKVRLPAKSKFFGWWSLCRKSPKANTYLRFPSINYFAKIPYSNSENLLCKSVALKSEIKEICAGPNNYENFPVSSFGTSTSHHHIFDFSPNSVQNPSSVGFKMYVANFNSLPPNSIHTIRGIPTRV
ncbi:unnamed protein product [Gordionus sp. m RMFG-2023]